MQVRITNVTDGPGKKPREARVYTKRLLPGAWMDVPIQFVDEKVRRLEQAGVIVIGKLPPWYSDYEARRKVRNLTPDEITTNLNTEKEFKKKSKKKVERVPDVAPMEPPIEIDIPSTPLPPPVVEERQTSTKKR